MPSFRLNALTRATRRWGTHLSLAVLLPLSFPVVAQDEQAAASVAPGHERVTPGHFINLQAPAASTSLRSSAEAGTELLLQETGMRIRSLTALQGDSFKDLQVMTGQLEGRARSMQAPGEMTLAARPDGSFIALLPDANAIIRGTADGQQSLIRFDAAPSHTPGSIDYVAGDENEVAGQQESQSGQRSFQAHRNA
ncbi:hypothetical protein ACPA5B_19755 [Pseudomonas solani]|uniref:hypothetical protein n=1 Tax=Pseudomonas solani TaxID=2731552 RepID=UPI003C2E75E2